MKNKLTYMLAFLPMLLAIFMFTNIPFAEASDNIEQVYYENNNYNFKQLIDVKQTTSYEQNVGPKYFSHKYLVENNPSERYNVYEYLFTRDVFQREKIYTTLTYQDKNINEVFKITIFKNGSSTRELVNRYENVISTYSTSSVSYSNYTLIYTEYLLDFVREYY